MKHFRIWAMIAFVLLVMLGTTVQAQQDISSPYAVVVDGDLWVYGVGDEPVMVLEGTQGGFSSIVWSDDGTKLAFLRYNEDYSVSLFVADIGSLVSPTEIALSSRLESVFPISFTPDGQILFAQPPTEMPSGDQPYMTEFYTVATTEGATPQLVGSAAFGIGCGGGSSIPADWAYWSDTGFGGSYLTLKWTPSGIVYSASCTGDTALLNTTTGESVEVGATLTRASLSPDGTHVAGIRPIYSEGGITGALEIVDLTTLAVTEVPTESSAEQTTWGADGTLYYSTRAVSSNLLEGLTAEQLQGVASGLGMEMTDLPAYTVTIHSYNPATGEDTLLYTGDGYAIARLRVVDEQTLIFSQIPNLNAWVEGLANGTLTTGSADYSTLASATVQTQVFALNLSDSTTQLLGTGWVQITPYVGS
jgi:hypothetical protein